MGNFIRKASDPGQYLLEVGPDELEYKASVHEGESIMYKESKASVESSSIVHILYTSPWKHITHSNRDLIGYLDMTLANVDCCKSHQSLQIIVELARESISSRGIQFVIAAQEIGHTLDLCVRCVCVCVCVYCVCVWRGQCVCVCV